MFEVCRKIDKPVFDIYVTVVTDWQNFVLLTFPVHNGQQKWLRLCFWELLKYVQRMKSEKTTKTDKRLFNLLLYMYIVHGVMRLIWLCLGAFKIWRSVVTGMKFPVWKLQFRFG